MKLPGWLGSAFSRVLKATQAQGPFPPPLKLKKNRNAACPSCKESKNVDFQQALIQSEKQWFDRFKEEHPDRAMQFGEYYEQWLRLCALNDSEGGWTWACDSCLDSGKALIADMAKHNYGVGTSSAAYVDQPLVCEDCDSPFVFSAFEQRHWYEELRFIVWAYPKQCVDCRRKRRDYVRTQKQLQDSLKQLDPNDPEQLLTISQLYEAMGISRKAEVFRARARNKARGS